MHVQALVVGPNRTLVSLDIGMVRPVMELWWAGVLTDASCEGADNLDAFLRTGVSRPYVMLRDPADIDTTLAVLANLGWDWVLETSNPAKVIGNPCIVPRWAQEYYLECTKERRG